MNLSPKSLLMDLLENLLESNKYKKEISNFSQPEIFDKDGLTVNDFTKILGTQAVQMLGAVLTGGGSTLVQEAGGALVEILTEKGAANLGVSREQFESLPEEQRNEQFMSIINSGDAELDKAMNIGIANAAVDTVGNFIAFGGSSAFRTLMVTRLVTKTMNSQTNKI